MELDLFHQKTIGSVKRQFAKNFPALKLEFFSRPHGTGKGSPLQQRLADNTTLAEINTLRREGSLPFTPAMTVADFERLLQNDFGLPVQVFRKSGEVWIETITTDHLSLEKQNSMGQATLRPVRANWATLFL